jgi:hypothetical protein
MSLARRAIVIGGLMSAIIGQLYLRLNPSLAILLLGISVLSVLVNFWQHPRPIARVAFSLGISTLIGLVYWREPRGWYFLVLAVILAAQSLRYQPHTNPDTSAPASTIDDSAVALEPAFGEMAQVPEKPLPNYKLGWLFGFLAATVGALLWFIFYKLTHWQFGLVAWAIGHMTARAVVRGAGGRSDRKLQTVAAILSGFGILGGYYLMLRDMVTMATAQNGVQTMSELKTFILVIYVVVKHPEVVGIWSVVFIAIGIYDAWKAARS